MISNLFRWLSLAAGLAAFSVAPLAIAEAQDVMESDDFYEFYEGSFDEEADEDDWFYDTYAYDFQPGGLDAYANYDWEANAFEWEEDGLFA